MRFGNFIFTLKQLGRVYLLCLAVTGLLSSQIQLQNWHVFFEESESHSAKEEADPCHLSIYHFSSIVQKECAHRNHISTRHHHCELCKFSHTSLLSSFEVFSSIRFLTGSDEILRLSNPPAKLSSASLHLQPRGPPQSV